MSPNYQLICRLVPIFTTSLSTARSLITFFRVYP